MDNLEVQRAQDDFEAKVTKKANKTTVNISALEKEKAYFVTHLDEKALCTTRDTA
jgi:hypothetical protein